MKYLIFFALASLILSNILLSLLTWNITRGTQTIEETVDIFAKACVKAALTPEKPY